MDQAKYNLVNEYFLVGVTEELEDFIMLLEAALPRFFRGATDLYRTGMRRTGGLCNKVDYSSRKGRVGKAKHTNSHNVCAVVPLNACPDFCESIRY